MLYTHRYARRTVRLRGERYMRRRRNRLIILIRAYFFRAFFSQAILKGVRYTSERRKKNHKLTLNGFESRRFCEFPAHGAGVPAALYNNNIIDMGRTGRGRRLRLSRRRRRRRQAVQNRLSKDFSENDDAISPPLAVPPPGLLSSAYTVSSAPYSTPCSYIYTPFIIHTHRVTPTSRACIKYYYYCYYHTSKH